MNFDFNNTLGVGLRVFALFIPIKFFTKVRDNYSKSNSWNWFIILFN